MLCPVCDDELGAPADWCPTCGSYLGFLRNHPYRVAYCIAASIALGVGLFFGLAWQVFAPLLWGSPPAGPGPLFWWAFSLATFFLTLGLAARQQLAKAFRRLFHGMH